MRRFSEYVIYPGHVWIPGCFGWRSVFLMFEEEIVQGICGDDSSLFVAVAFGDNLVIFVENERRLL